MFGAYLFHPEFESVIPRIYAFIRDIAFALKYSVFGFCVVSLEHEGVNINHICIGDNELEVAFVKDAPHLLVVTVKPFKRPFICDNHIVVHAGEIWGPPAVCNCDFLLKSHIRDPEGYLVVAIRDAGIACGNRNQQR